MARVVSHVKRRSPGLRVLMWHDMIEGVQLDSLPEEVRLAEPVVWRYIWQRFNIDKVARFRSLSSRYTPELSLPPGLLQRLSSGFPSGVWAATAFKACIIHQRVIPGKQSVAN